MGPFCNYMGDQNPNNSLVYKLCFSSSHSLFWQPHMTQTKPLLHGSYSWPFSSPSSSNFILSLKHYHFLTSLLLPYTTQPLSSTLFVLPSSRELQWRSPTISGGSAPETNKQGRKQPQVNILYLNILHFQHFCAIWKGEAEWVLGVWVQK